MGAAAAGPSTSTPRRLSPRRPKPPRPPPPTTAAEAAWRAHRSELRDEPRPWRDAGAAEAPLLGGGALGEAGGGARGASFYRFDRIGEEAGRGEDSTSGGGGEAAGGTARGGGGGAPTSSAIWSLSHRLMETYWEGYRRNRRLPKVGPEGPPPLSYFEHLGGSLGGSLGGEAPLPPDVAFNVTFSAQADDDDPLSRPPSRPVGLLAPNGCSQGGTGGTGGSASLGSCGGAAASEPDAARAERLRQAEMAARAYSCAPTAPRGFDFQAWPAAPAVSLAPAPLETADAGAETGQGPPGADAMATSQPPQWGTLEGLLRSEGLKLRVIDIFRRLDRDGDGSVTRGEFLHRMRELGAPVALGEQVAALFEAIDADASGEIRYKELNRTLRKGREITLASELRDRVLAGQPNVAVDKKAKGLARSRVDAASEMKAEAAMAAVEAMEYAERMGLPWPSGNANEGDGAPPPPPPAPAPPPPPLPRKETLAERSSKLLMAKQAKADRKKAMLDLVAKC
jgi:hypothetical protein